MQALEWISKDQIRNDPTWSKLRNLKAPDTIKTYEDWLPHFLEHSQIKTLTDVVKVQPSVLFDMISGYVRKMVERNLSDSAINVNISALKFLLKGNGIKNTIDWEAIEMYAVKPEDTTDNPETIIIAYQKHQLERILKWAKKNELYRLMVETSFPATSGIRVGVLGGRDAIQFKDMSLLMRCRLCEQWLEEKKWLQFWQLVPHGRDDKVTDFEGHMIDNHADIGTQFVWRMRGKDFEKYVDMSLFSLNPYSDDKTWRYITFTSPQATGFARTYFEKRLKRGEQFSSESYLITDDRTNSGKGISRVRVQKDIREALLALGIRKEKHDHERTDLQVAHSMRAFFDTTVSGTPVSALIKERLLGHSIIIVDGIKIVHSKAYFKPNPIELLLGKDKLKGYIEAIPALEFNLN